MMSEKEGGKKSVPPAEKRINMVYDKKQELVKYIKETGVAANLTAFIFEAIREKWDRDIEYRKNLK